MPVRQLHAKQLQLVKRKASKVIYESEDFKIRTDAKRLPNPWIRLVERRRQLELQKLPQNRLVRKVIVKKPLSGRCQGNAVETDESQCLRCTVNPVSCAQCWIVMAGCAPKLGDFRQLTHKRPLQICVGVPLLTSKLLHKQVNFRTHLERRPR